MDRTSIDRTVDVAMLESAADQRFATTDHGSVRASRVHFTGPSTRNDAAVTRLRRPGRHAGNAVLLMRDALDLSSATGLSLQLAAHTANHRALPVRVVLRRSFGGAVRLGTVHVGPRTNWVHFTLPASARGFRNMLSLKVGAKGLHRVGNRGRLAVYDVRASV
jgi:hypothetical protein